MRVAALVAGLAGLASASPYRISDYVRSGINIATAGNNISASRTTSLLSAATPSSTVEPCLLVSQALANGTSNNTVDPDLAYTCLRSVPLDRDGDLAQIEGVKFYAQFQTTLAYLKSPPEGYLMPSVDIIGALDQLTVKLKSNAYSNEYDFQMDLMDVIASAYDEHFIYIPDITQIFSFYRLASLFSVSKDGLSLPEVYLGAQGDDVTTAFPKNSSTNTKLSPVLRINGQEVEAWLNGYAAINGRGQDLDNNYNTIFAAPSSFLSPSRAGLFARSAHYQGPNTVVTLRNGTTVKVAHYAFSQFDFTGVIDGESLFQSCCTPNPSPTNDSSPSPASIVIPTTEVPFRPVPTRTANLGPDSYPVPVVINDDSSVAGYFPEDKNDLAVLSIPSFKPNDYVQFSNVVREFLATSQAAGKRRLVIDLRGNPGGNVVSAYDTFAQLFPQIEPYGATNFRATPLVNDIGKIVSGFYANITNTTATLDDCSNDFSGIHPFNFREELTVNNTAFTSWKELYGPYEHHGDNFTALLRYNLDDGFSTFCELVSNHDNLTNITTQVFQPEDTLLIQDGACASTCAIFTEFMKTQAGVKQVVFGGRKQTGPMQGVGGVKGANDYGYNIYQRGINEAYDQDATPAQRQYLLRTYGNVTQRAQQAINRGRAYNLNVRNNIRLGDDSVTPLQFVYEAADCRLFYTAAQLASQGLVWRAAYDAHWGNASCVPGSTQQPSSGLAISNSPPPAARNRFGANVTSVYPSNLKPYTNATRLR